MKTKKRVKDMNELEYIRYKIQKTNSEKALKSLTKEYFKLFKEEYAEELKRTRVVLTCVK